MPRAGHRRSILFLAGDLSGDAHAARLARTLAERNPDVTVHVLGGRKLGEAATTTGGKWIDDTTNCSAIGLGSVLKIYFWARWMQLKMRRFVRSTKVDLAVLCDWGGFNCRQLEFFKKSGIPVLYYFPPRSWQRTGTAGLQFAQHVARVATPFQWSATRLAGVGCKAHWVGHPLLETAREGAGREALRREFGVPENGKLIALLPGSRLSEIRVLCPRMASTAVILAREGPAQFVVPVPEPLVEKARSYFPASYKILVGRAADALRACDAAVVKMGSATLEAAVIGAPQVAVYDFGWLVRAEWILLWAWKRIPFIAMPNIILQREIVPEILGLNCRPEIIAAAIGNLLHNDEARQTMEAGYEEIRSHLGKNLPLCATEQTAQIVEDMLGIPEAGNQAAPPKALLTS